MGVESSSRVDGGEGADVTIGITDARSEGAIARPVVEPADPISSLIEVGYGATIVKKAFLILGELNNEDIDWLARQGRKRTLEPEETLIFEDQQISALYFVLRGEFSVVLDPPVDRELARISTGEVIGEISFVDSRLPIATVKAIAPCEVLEIPRFRLTSKLNQDLGFASRFYRGLSLCLCDRMRATVRRLGYGTALDAPELSNPKPLTLDPQDLDLVRAKFQWLVQQTR